MEREEKYRRSFYITEEECAYIKQCLKEFRAGKNSTPLRDIEKRLSALEARFNDDKLTLD